MPLTASWKRREDRS